jgi:hypothetical protein
MNTDTEDDEAAAPEASHIQSLVRVNPASGFKSGSVHIDSEYNEVVLVRESDALHHP